MSALPVLAPRIPGCSPAAKEKVCSKEHTDEEWETVRGVIHDLYIRDNLKLHETMTIMRARHGFSATFKKWNIRKRSYRKTQASIPTFNAETPAVSPTEAPGDTAKATTTGTDSPLDLVQPSTPGLYASFETVLCSVFFWSQAKIECPQLNSDPMANYLARPNQPPIQDSRTMYRTFELVFDLWSHGKGNLAGIAARRGFYALEYVLTDDHPDLIWHVLDTIYDMIDRGHLQLLVLFLEHATVLAHRQLPAQHPLLRILDQLRQCDYQTDEGRGFIRHLLRQAWLRNVSLLTQHTGTTGPRRLWLYEQLIWDGRTSLRKNSDLGKSRDTMDEALDVLVKDLAGSGRIDDESDRLRAEALRLEFTQMDIGDKIKAERLARSLLRQTETDSTSRTSARFHAYARKMLARVHQDRQEWDVAEENLRQAITKREAAHGTVSNLRVIRDMWVLANHFKRAGRIAEAETTTADALVRAQQYLEDIPL